MKKSIQNKINAPLDKINAAERVCKKNNVQNMLYLRILNESKVEYINTQKQALNGIFKEKKKE